MFQSSNHGISQLINQSIKETSKQSINQSINQLINQSINQSINQAINQSIKSIKQTNSYLSVKKQSFRNLTQPKYESI